jgi:dihydroneopterin aldolase
VLTKLFIRDLAVPCIIGITKEKRQEKQIVIINIDMWATIDQVFTTDAIEDTLNYKDLYMEVVTLVTNSQFHIVEVLADAIANLCMQQEKIQRVDVTVEKPSELWLARSAGVVITKQRNNE